MARLRDPYGRDVDDVLDALDRLVDAAERVGRPTTLMEAAGALRLGPLELARLLIDSDTLASGRLRAVSVGPLDVILHRGRVG